MERSLTDLGEAVVALIPEIVDRLMVKVPAEDPPGYGSVDLTAARRLAEDAMSLYVTAALVEQRLPGPQDVEWMHEAVQARADLGVPLASIVGSIPTTFAAIWNECARQAERLGIDAAGLTDAGSLIWGWAATFAREATRVYQEIDAMAVRADERRRAWLLRNLLAGSLSTATSIELGAFGLARGERYHTFRARAASGSDAQLERFLIAAATRDSGLVGVVGDDLAGILRVPPRLDGMHGVVALGPAADLTTLAPSFEIATRVLESALRHGLQGVVRLEDLGLGLAVSAEDAIGRGLVTKYLEPLDAEGEFGLVIEDTLRVLIECNMQIDEAAKKMVVHPNTLRYRMRRFEELTGADSKSTQQMFEVWWALRRRALDRIEP